MMNFLKRLCSDGFSEDAFKTLCSRKWSSFASASVPLPNDADFVAPKLFGFVRNLPASMQNAGLQLAVPVVVARLPEGKELGERSSRKRQFDFAKKALAAISDSGRAGGIVLGGLFAFYDAGGNFRLSLVSGTPDAATHKLRYNSFRRQSFYVSKGGTDCRTFIERLAMPADSFAALREIFSVEKLTKEFYAQVEAWFLRARERVRFPGAAELGKDELTHNSDMALRLITRLIFIWFLRAKKLVPEELFDKRKIDELLKYDDVNGSTYYKAILQNLFFATLNTKIGERGWVERRAGKQEYFRYKRFFKNDAKSKYLFDICANVPFVNGGLFENLDRADVRIDCFSNRKDNEPLLSVPDELFFDTEKGILPLLSRYNFTVEENAPADEDVSLDPELLGRVFENLLAFVNPETHEQARKATGSFYTPREIVRYMVDESLVAYLTEKCGAENVAAVRSLVTGTADDAYPPPISSSLSEKIVAALDGVKILDPACGSGAFPMGALARIVEIHEALGTLDPSDGKAVYKKKLAVIQNCLYGVDIQSIAVQISKLRFFISLLCEQKVNRARENFGINVLPNLESKIVCANTLVALPQKLDGGNAGGDELALGDVDEIRALRERLKTSRKNYFSASSKQDKARLRKEDEKLRAALAQKMLANAGHADAKFRKSVELVASWNPYDPNTSAPFFDPVWMFGFDRPDAFDIVIGNPPYGAKISREGINHVRENYDLKTTESAILFLEKGFHFVPCGWLIYIIPKSYCFASNYSECRRYSEKYLNQIVDCGKVFENVKFEANIVFLSREERPTYENLLYKEKVFFRNSDIEKSIANEFGFFLNGVSKEEISLAQKLRGIGLFLTPSYASNSRGSTLQKFLSERGEFIGIGGKEIQRYVVVQEKGRLKRSVAEANPRSEIKENSVLVQNIVAHVERPIPKIKIIALPISNNRRYRILDTLNQLVIFESVSNKFISALLNSELVNWYVYRFIFGKAIRTMHFDNAITNRIPVPSATREQQAPIIALVDKILEAKRGNADADTSAWEAEIDRLVYALYGLTAEEIALVENQRDAGASSAAPETGTPVSASSQQSPQEGSAPRAGAYDPALDD